MQIVVYGKSFNHSARDAWELFQSTGFEALVTYDCSALFYSLLRARTRRVISSQDEDAAFAQRLQSEEFLQVYRGEARSSQASISCWVVFSAINLFVSTELPLQQAILLLQVSSCFVSIEIGNFEGTYWHLGLMWDLISQQLMSGPLLLSILFSIS
ncbi:uncharacterized protein LOC130743391 isoform X2 [Lotus japonicus]|uniref:uncharacterized protein LOC130743391 isoform X2 n=1 Tax=Lotus japonicus TaxID=34305 RepID=UPI0025838B58|nr:uncharacterized protein LOC130743391 isoform X2 [Lotus japonicus]XP_057451604.1 uncharacterized protein LOC130743391 isoform X2 [Lotus japonicus]